MKKPPAIVRFFLSIISFVLCVCLFVAAIGTIVIADVRALTGKDTLKDIISDMMFSPVASRQIPAAAPQLAGLHQIRMDENFTMSDAKPNAMVEWMYGFLSEALGAEANMTYEQVNAFFEASTAKDFLSEKVAGIISDIYTGEQTTTITAEELTALVAENRDLIQSQFGVTLTDEQLQGLTAWVEESGITQMFTQEGIAGLLGENMGEPLCTGVESLYYVFAAITGDAEMHLPTLLEAARFLASDTVMYGLLGLCAALLALLVLVNLVQIHVGLIDGGITLFFAGGLMLLPSVLSSFLVGGYLPTNYQSLLQHLLGATMPAAVVTVVAGVVLIAGGIVLRILLPKRRALI